MKSVCAFFVAAIIASMLIAAYDAAVAINVHKGETCLHNGKSYEQGAKWQEKGKCQQLLCRRSDETHVHVEYQSCGAVGAGPGYELDKGNPNLKYPDCCPKPVPIGLLPHNHHHNHPHRG